jgi:hypothetical protein
VRENQDCTRDSIRDRDYILMFTFTFRSQNLVYHTITAFSHGCCRDHLSRRYKESYGCQCKELCEAYLASCVAAVIVNQEVDQNRNYQ